MLFQKRFILVLFHERFKLPSSHHWNFWLRIKLFFQNSDLWAKFPPPPLKFPMVTWYIFWIHKFGDVVHSLLSGNPCSTNCHMTWLPPELLRRRLMTILLFPFLILSLIFSFLHISSPHPKDNYSVGCMFLILQFALIGPLHSRVFTCAKITLVLALLSLSSSVTL